MVQQEALRTRRTQGLNFGGSAASAEDLTTVQRDLGMAKGMEMAWRGKVEDKE